MTKINLKLLSKKAVDSTFSTSDIQKLLLKNRSISQDLKSFLKPPFPKAPDIDFQPSLDFIKKYRDKTIFVYADYDVDGITSATLLYQTLTSLDYQVHPYIPHRQHDGYGFNYQSFKKYLKKKDLKIDLIISVDNGIVAHNEIKKAREDGYDFLVIDHHLSDKKLPPANLILHSTNVAAAGLTWLFCHHLSQNADLGLAALGTVADCLPLTSLNRSLVIHGLNSLNANPSPGIKKLVQISGATLGNINSFDLGFLLAPRINATGRLADPMDSLRLLCSKNSLQASKYASILHTQNQLRKDLQKDATETALKNIKGTPKGFLVISDPSFNPGIIGLLAGRLTEKYYLPTLVISQDKDISKGSARSISQINLIKVLRNFQHLFSELGGHPAAAGFSIPTKNIPTLKKELKKYFNTHFKNLDLKPSLEVDAPFSPQALSLKNIKAIQDLQPFGIGNPQPLFLFKDLELLNHKLLGKDQSHLKLTLKDPRHPQNFIDAIAFKKGDYAKNLNPPQLISLVASLDINTWNSHSKPQLIVQEIL